MCEPPWLRRPAAARAHRSGPKRFLALRAFAPRRTGRYVGGAMWQRIPLFALALVVSGSARAQLGAPTPSFALFRCSCQASPAEAQPAGRARGGVFALFGRPTVEPWSGTVYATSEDAAVLKAQSACSAERRGSLFSCLACRCSR